MTADEMFQQLGYERLSYIADEHWYRKVMRDERITIIIDSTIGIVTCKEGKKDAPLNFQEILACAQLIKEMEEKE